MPKNQVKTLQAILDGIATLSILLGAIFMILHYSYGKIIFYIGIFLAYISYEAKIYQLKKEIKELKEEKNETDKQPLDEG